MLTLCVPTMNRPAFLARLLRYYADARVPYWFFIGDSSDPESAQRNQRTVASWQGTLKIRYQHSPGCSACACLEQLSLEITTPYCAFLGDDDFLCIAALEQCVAFLEGHADYGAARGMGLMFQTEDNRPHGAFGNVGYYPQAALEASTGMKRLREFFTESQYALLFAVHRTATWQAMFRGLSALPGIRNRNEFKDELIATCVSVIRGKLKALDCLCLVHQVHEDSYHFPHVYDRLTDPAWLPSYQAFHERLVEELSRQDGASAEEARTVIREVFWPYLATQVIHDWRIDTAARLTRDPSRLRWLARKLPGARRGWRALRSMAQRARDPWSLPALLHPSSPYHADFMPIYRLVTSGPLEPPEEDGAVTHAPRAMMVGSG